MVGKELRAHFANANVYDSLTTAIALNFIPTNHEAGLMKGLLSEQPQPEEITIMLGIKLLGVASVMFANSFTEREQITRGNFATEKVMQITTPAIYAVTGWNLLQIGLDILK